MFKANSDYVFLVEDFSENVTKSGIIFTDDPNKPVRGIVIAVGDGKHKESGVFIPTTVKVKDKILFEKKAAIPVTLEGVDCLMISEKDVLAVFED